MGSVVTGYLSSGLPCLQDLFAILVAFTESPKPRPLSGVRLAIW